MKQIVQLIGAVMAGLVVSFLITVQFERLGEHWYPYPEINPSPIEYMQYMATSPALLHVLSILGYGLSVFFGVYVGGRLSPRNYCLRGAYITGFAYFLPIVIMLICFPRPVWAILGILTITTLFFLFSAFLLKKVSQNR